MQVNTTDSSSNEFSQNSSGSILSRSNNSNNSPEYAIQQQLRYNIESGNAPGSTGGSGSPNSASRVSDTDVSAVAAAAAAAQGASGPEVVVKQSPEVLAQSATRNYGSERKPPVGTEEYYKIKKDNHKEVERRRRETINKGIEELSKVVPDCDRHKGQILSRAVEYIRKLKEQEQQYIEKLTLEKLLSEQAISELQTSHKSLKTELQTAWKEVEHYKRQLEEKSK